MGILKLSIILQHLEFSSLGSKGSTMIGSVPLISQRQKGQPWPSDSYSKTKKAGNFFKKETKPVIILKVGVIPFTQKHPQSVSKSL